MDGNVAKLARLSRTDGFLFNFPYKKLLGNQEKPGSVLFYLAIRKSNEIKALTNLVEK